MDNKEKFLKLVSQEDNKTLNKIKWRNANRKQLRASQEIAKKVVIRLRELGWSKTKLAEELGVSKQQVSKIVKGQENFTISTIVKLEDVLKIKILAVRQEVKTITPKYFGTSETDISMVSENLSPYNTETTPKYTMHYNKLSGEYSHCKNAV